MARIIRLLVTGNSPSRIAKQLPGYTPKRYEEFKRKVDQVQDMLNMSSEEMEQLVVGETS